MQFSEFLAILRRRRLVVLVVFALCVLVAGAYALHKPKRYESTATIAFTPNPTKGQAFLAPENLNALLATYAELAKSRQNRLAAGAYLGHPVTGTVSTSSGTGGILQISGIDASPHSAQETASVIVRAFVHSIENNGVLVANVINPPTESATPLQPRPPLIISIAALLGLIVGVLYAFLLDRFRGTAEDAAELTQVTGLPVVGRLSRERALEKGNSQLIWSSPELEGAREAFRALRTNVELLMEEQPSTIQITSAGPRNGKSTVVANLGIALGQIGIKVTIVDADLRNPRQHEIFGLENKIGLSSALMLPDSDISIQSTSFTNVSVLTSGLIPANAPDILHVRFRSVLRTLREDTGIVLIDSPPALPVSDAPLIARYADAVLVVVAVDRTKMSAVSATVDKLRFAQANPIGLVLNFAELDKESVGGYGYGYGDDLVQDPGPVLQG
jgi:polysaccharide biosynthesis transport protein